MSGRFQKLYKRKVYTHHYKEYMELECFDSAYGNLQELVAEYRALEEVQRPQITKRIIPIIWLVEDLGEEILGVWFGE